MNRRICQQIEHLTGVWRCHTTATSRLLIIVEAILVLLVALVVTEFWRLCGALLYSLGVRGAVDQLSLVWLLVIINSR